MRPRQRAVALLVAALLIKDASSLLSSSEGVHAVAHASLLRDGAPASRLARQRLQAASSALKHQTMARRRQHWFCEDKRPSDTALVARLAALRQHRGWEDNRLSGTLNRTIVIKVNNFSICLYKRDDVLSDSVAAQQGWEQQHLPKLLRAMQAPLPATAVGTTSNAVPLFLDIGANVGWYTMNMAAHGFRVAAFEGMRANQLLVRTSLCLQPHLMALVTFYPFGLGSKKALCYIKSHRKNIGDGILDCGPAGEAGARHRMLNKAYQLRGSTRVEALDSLIQEDVKVLKMDVEGFEQLVLEGGEALFTKHKVWYIMTEFNPTLLRGALERVGKAPFHLLQTLRRHRYRISMQGFEGPWLNATALGHLASFQQDAVMLFCSLPEVAGPAYAV